VSAASAHCRNEEDYDQEESWKCSEEEEKAPIDDGRPSPAAAAPEAAAIVWGLRQ